MSKELWFIGVKNPEEVIIMEAHTSITSTQKIARERASSLKKSKSCQWLLITAEEQTEGIGQHSRIWVSPPNFNIYATFVLPWPKEHQSKLINVAQVTTISIAETVENFGFNPKIKWINDILINDKKICGVLCESKISPDGIMLLVGIGLNVNMPYIYTKGVDQPITSLSIESQQEWNKEDILRILKMRLFYNLKNLIEKGFYIFHRFINERLAYINEQVIVEDNGVEHHGKFVGITKDGAIILQNDNVTKTLATGRMFKNIL